MKSKGVKVFIVIGLLILGGYSAYDVLILQKQSNDINIDEFLLDSIDKNGDNDSNIEENPNDTDGKNIELKKSNLSSKDKDDLLDIIYKAMPQTSLDKIVELKKDGFTKEEFIEARNLLNEALSDGDKQQIQKIFE